MYGRTLLALQERIAGRLRCSAALAMLSARPQTTSRIHAIARFRTPTTTERLATLLVLFVFGAVALTDAQEKQPQAVIVPLVESGSAHLATAPPQKASKPQGLEEVLQQPVNLHFEGRELAEIVGEFVTNYEINVVMDQRAILPPGVKGSAEDDRKETYIESVDLKEVTLAEALTSILKPLGLDYKVQPGFIWISLPETLRHESFEELETRYYEAPGVVNGKLKDVNGKDTDLDLVTFIQSRVPAIREPRTGEALSAMHWHNDSKMLIVRDIPENFIQIEALIEALGIPTEEQPPVQAASPADAPNSPPAALPEAGPLSVLDIVNLPPLRSQQLKQLGLESMKINMLRDPTPLRPLGMAIINLDKVQISELIPRTKAKLIGIDETRSLIGIEMTDTGERFRMP